MNLHSKPTIFVGFWVTKTVNSWVLQKHYKFPLRSLTCFSGEAIIISGVRPIIRSWCRMTGAAQVLFFCRQQLTFQQCNLLTQCTVTQNELSFQLQRKMFPSAQSFATIKKTSWHPNKDVTTLWGLLLPLPVSNSPLQIFFLMEVTFSLSSISVYPNNLKCQ